MNLHILYFKTDHKVSELAFTDYFIYIFFFRKLIANHISLSLSLRYILSATLKITNRFNYFDNINGICRQFHSNIE